MADVYAGSGAAFIATGCGDGGAAFAPPGPRRYVWPRLRAPLPVCADESCHDRASLPGLRAKYDMVNIKLDKTGGLTEALALRDAGPRAGRLPA